MNLVLYKSMSFILLIFNVEVFVSICVELLPRSFCMFKTAKEEKCECENVPLFVVFSIIWKHWRREMQQQ